MECLNEIEEYKLAEEEDFYKILGCDALSTTDQIMAEYRVKARKFHPDKNLCNPKATSDFTQLQKAKEVLTDPQSRKDCELCNQMNTRTCSTYQRIAADKLRKEYDRWKYSGIAISFKKWKSMGGSVKMSMHWTTKVKIDPMIECQPAEGSCDTTVRKSTSTSSSVGAGAFPREFSETLRRFRNYEI